MEQKVHQGRNVKRFREMLGIKQEALAYELGEEWNQKKISLLEQKEAIETSLLKQISEVSKADYVNLMQKIYQEEDIKDELIIKRIKEIKKSISIPIQLGGGIRSVKRAKELFDIGIDRIILGTIAIENPALVRVLSKEYPKRIAVGIDAKEGIAAFLAKRPPKRAGLP